MKFWRKGTEVALEKFQETNPFARAHSEDHSWSHLWIQCSWASWTLGHKILLLENIILETHVFSEILSLVKEIAFRIYMFVCVCVCTHAHTHAHFYLEFSSSQWSDLQGNINIDFVCSPRHSTWVWRGDFMHSQELSNSLHMYNNKSRQKQVIVLKKYISLKLSVKLYIWYIHII